jgi:hypothetical protein
MPQHEVLTIVRRIHLDRQFRDRVHASETEEELLGLVQVLCQDGIQATMEDLHEALKVDRVIEQLQLKPEPVGREVALSPPGQKGPPQGEEFDLGLELQKSLLNVIKQIDKGYGRVMAMYTVAFYLGVALVIAAVVASLTSRGQTVALIMGGLGMADMIAATVFKPAQKLQNSRSDLAQLQAAFFSWINDVHNWDSYLRLIDQDVTKNRSPLSFERVREVSALLIHNTERMMQLMEQYCETSAEPSLRTWLPLGKKKVPGPAMPKSAETSVAQTTGDGKGAAFRTDEPRAT